MLAANGAVGEDLKSAGDSVERRYELRFSPSPDAVEKSGWRQLRIFQAQKADQPIVIEAEESTLIVFTDRDVAPVRDAEASGGMYIKDVSELENDLVVETPGDYQVWYRAYFPVKGNWNHHEKMDDNEPVVSRDSDNGPNKQWVWVKGPVYNLSKGEHRQVFPAPTGWRGGARLDKIVLMPTTSPESVGMGPEASLCEKRISKSTAELISNRLALGEMASWRLECEKNGNVGEVEIDYSLDRGKSWQALPEGKIHEVKDPKTKVMFRVRLSTNSKTVSPQFRNMALVGTLRSH